MPLPPGFQEANDRAGVKEKKPEGWDWPFLYYTGTVILQMTPRKFWRSTPALLNALVSVHARLNDPQASKKQANTIEEVPFEI